METTNVDCRIMTIFKRAKIGKEMESGPLTQLLKKKHGKTLASVKSGC